MTKDITTRNDIELLVNKFYDKVKTDQLLGPVFSNVDWRHHLPVMYSFWDSVLLEEGTYKGNPLQKHLGLPVNAVHFNQWLALFFETVDENFTGRRADEAKSRAESIAGIFQAKMGLLKKGE